jgi:ATP:ADP antiporter, AAA family
MTTRARVRPSPVDTMLRIFADVRPGEAGTALLLAVTGFLYLASANVAKVLREPLILVGGGPTLSGAQLKSYTSAGAALLLLAVVPLYGRLAGKVPRRRLMNIVSPVFVACFGGFFLLARLLVPVGVPFFMFLAVFNVMIVAQFWAFANDLYTDDEGRRLFPVVGVGATAGAAAGALLAGRVAALNLNLSVLFLVAAAPLVLAVMLTNVVDTRERHREEQATHDALTSGLLPAATAQYRDATGEFRQVGDEYRAASGLHPTVSRNQPPPKEAASMSTVGAFGLVLRNRYLLLIALLVLILNWVNTSGEIILSDVIARRAAALVSTPEAEQAVIARFYGGFLATTNLVTLGVQLFLVSRFIKYLGVRGSMLVLPLIALGGYGLMALVPVLGAIRWAKILENSTDYSLNNTVRHTLFLPTTREEKYKAKQVTDSFAQRAGDVLSAVTVFIATGVLGLAASRLAYFNLALVAVWLVIAVRIGRQYDRLAAATKV